MGRRACAYADSGRPLPRQLRHDWRPVGNRVGAVSRQGIVEALQSEGSGYVQGVMTRSFQTAQPDDSLVKTLRRIMAGQGAQLVPILDGNRIVGIITPQNLAHSMGLLNARRRLRQNERED